MKKFLLLLCILASTSQAYAWNMQKNFEDGIVGEIATGSDGLTMNAAQATYDKTHVYSGNMALNAQVWAGATAYGGAINYPSSIGEGDEVWYRARWYFPTSWQFTNTSGMKIMRIAGSAGGGDWWDIYIDKDTHQIEPHTDLGTAKVAFNTYKYNQSPLLNGPHGQHGEPVKIDAWNTYEIYVKFSADPNKAIIRIWQEGKLVFNCAGVVPTLGSSSNKSDRVLVGNYYNGNAPKTQSAWVDDIVVTSDRPSNSDDYGNPMIGMTNGPMAARPNPPESLNLVVQ